MSLVQTYKLKIPDNPRYTEISKECASVWNECIKLSEVYAYTHGRSEPTYVGNPRIFDSWVDKKLSKDQKLHSQTIQAVRKKYTQSWDSFYTHQKNGNKDARPPGKLKNHFTPTWLKSAIYFEKDKNQVKLSMGRGREPLYIDLHKSFNWNLTDIIVQIELVYNYGQRVLHCTYKSDLPKYPKIKEPERIFGVDLGEIHPFVVSDESETHIFNGRYIRSLYRLRNKRIGAYQKLISRCKKHSKRYKKLIRRKWKYLNYLDNHIRDCIDKQIAKFIKLCQRKRITKVFIGDVSEIRNQINFGKKANQKLHQWPFAQLSEKLKYRLKNIGIEVEFISEAYTSRTCPSCNDQTKPTNRNFKCKSCAFEYHRDGIGSINIRRWGLLKKKDRPQKLENVSGADQTRSIPVVSSMSTTFGYRLKLA